MTATPPSDPSTKEPRSWLPFLVILACPAKGLLVTAGVFAAGAPAVGAGVLAAAANGTLIGVRLWARRRSCAARIEPSPEAFT